MKNAPVSFTTTKMPRKCQCNGRYLHFKDGKKIDMWEGVLEGNLSSMKKIDRTIKKQQIPFTVRKVPMEEGVDEFFNQKDREINHDFYSRRI